MSDSTSDDAELIKQYREGDTKAFEKLYERYKDEVVKIFLIKGLPENDAFDCCQDVFLNLINYLKTEKLRIPFHIFLRKIIKHKVADFYRRKSTSQFIVFCLLVQDLSEKNPDELQKFYTQLHKDSHNQFDFIEFRDAVEVCLQQFKNPRWKLILILWLENFQFDQISELLEIPIGTVSSCLSRCRPLLIECLKLNYFDTSK